MENIQTARRLIAEERENKTGFLDLGNLRLIEVPAEVFELTHLRSLNLGPWYITEGGSYKRSTNVEDDSPNAVQSLPDGIRALGRLVALSLEGNPLSDLRPLQTLTALQYLNCSRTSVSDLGPLQTLTALQDLVCWGTTVSDLGPLQTLTALRHLLCWSTTVSDLGPLQTLTALRHLNCSRTPVSDLGPLQTLTALQHLDCSDTSVSDLGPLQTLTALQHLDCSGTSVSDLGPLQNLTVLQVLECSRTSVSDLGPLQTLTALQHLDCSGTSVSDLGPLQNLTVLQVLECSLTSVSDLGPLQTLTALQHLDCSGTSVSDLGPLQTLTALQNLDCSRTSVSDLGPLQTLTALQYLDCSRTSVSDLGPLQNLTALQVLDCWSTSVSELGPLQNLTALQVLNCSETSVSDLGPLVGLAALEDLTANACELADFPRQVLFQARLSDLRLHEAIIPGIPRELLSPDQFSSCLEDLRNHLIDADVGTEEVREAKLVVLGNGRVGKTQLCRRLRGLAYDENVPSTHGITVTAEPWAGSTEGEALNIWDFGGQDIYHGAHTLFMKTSAVFLVVWHPDFETAGEQSLDGMEFRNFPLPYWLEYVRTLGSKDCPVVVVQTRCDRPEQEVRRLPADDASLAFPSLKPCWYSARNKRGHGALEDALRDAIGSLRERDGIATIGAGRMRVLRQLEAWRSADQGLAAEERLHRTLSQTEFRNLCDQVQGVSSPESLLAYLHNLGVVFYQPDLFHDRVILDQSWALEAVYGVFDRRKAYPLILSQGGRFTQSLLAMTAWRDYSEQEQRLFLSLMESCGIAFVHREADLRLGLEVEYLAPDVLPEKDGVAAQLAGRWDDRKRSWRLEYEYPFLHPGLMRALLCDVGRESREAGVYWKYGVWVYESSTGCRALLEQHMADERRGRIALRVQGRRHEDLARWLRERIKDRNRLFGYPELKPAVDEFGPAMRTKEREVAPHTRIPGHKAAGLTEQSAKDHVAGAQSVRAAAEPAFDKPPGSSFPSREPQVFVSYAWGDETPAGQHRAKLVDDLCAALARQAVKVRRDRDEMRPGDLISEFMDRLTEGDLVLAVISDKYLRSEYCMYELFRIYRNCADKPERFLGKVIPLILPDAGLDSLASRLQRAVHWTKQEEDLKPLVEGHIGAVGTEFFRKFKLIGEFARNASNMLEHLVDKLQPRDFERQAQEGFKEVLSQIGNAR